MDQFIKPILLSIMLAEVSRKNYQNTNTGAIKYGYTNFGLAPSFVVLKTIGL
jgi:hypothetical protein